MVKTIKYSLVATAVLGMILLGAAMSSSPAMAQDSSSQGASTQAVGPGHQAENPGSRSDTTQAFDKWMRKNPQARREIMKDPSLLNNPDYMAKHPDLQKFMNDHPDFQRAVNKNPERMMHKAQHNERRAAAHRHAQNGRPVHK
jgi:hypothetical protein